MDSTGTRSEWVNGTAAAGTGLAVLTFALFPLAAPLVVVAAVGAVLAGVWIVLRMIARGARRLAGRGRGEAVAAKPHPESAVPQRQRALG